MKNLPRGIWYEAAKKRYRVRLYRNHVPHLHGYYATLAAAVKGLDELQSLLKKIPKQRKRGIGSHAPVHSANLSGVVGALRQRQLNDPNLLRRCK